MKPVIVWNLLLGLSLCSLPVDAQTIFEVPLNPDGTPMRQATPPMKSDPLVEPGRGQTGRETFLRLWNLAGEPVAFRLGGYLLRLQSRFLSGYSTGVSQPEELEIVVGDSFQKLKRGDYYIARNPDGRWTVAPCAAFVTSDDSQLMKCLGVQTYRADREDLDVLRPDNTMVSLNDRIGVMQVLTGCVVRLCQDTDGGGPCSRYRAGTHDKLSALGVSFIEITRESNACGHLK